MMARVVVNVRENDRSGVKRRRKFMEGEGDFVDVGGGNGLSTCRKLNTNKAGAGAGAGRWQAAE